MNQSISGRSLQGPPQNPPSGRQRVADAIADALHREFGETHAAIKSVVALTGANERAVRNWFDAKNGPSGEFVIALCRCSDSVFQAVLRMAGREREVQAKRIVDATQRLRELLAVLDDLEGSEH